MTKSTAATDGGHGLIMGSNLSDPDAAYRAIIEAHRGLSPDQSAALNAALVLALANHIGSLSVLEGAIELATQALGQRSAL